MKNVGLGVMMFVVLMTLVAFGSTCYFTGAVDYRFEDPNNWQSNQMPVAGDDIVIQGSPCKVYARIPVKYGNVYIQDPYSLTVSPSLALQAGSYLWVSAVSMIDSTVLTVNAGSDLRVDSLVTYDSSWVRLYGDIYSSGIIGIYEDSMISYYSGKILCQSYTNEGHVTTSQGGLYVFAAGSHSYHSRGNFNYGNGVNLSDLKIFAMMWMESD